MYIHFVKGEKHTDVCYNAKVNEAIGPHAVVVDQTLSLVSIFNTTGYISHC